MGITKVIETCFRMQRVDEVEGRLEGEVMLLPSTRPLGSTPADPLHPLIRFGSEKRILKARLSPEDELRFDFSSQKCSYN